MQIKTYLHRYRGTEFLREENCFDLSKEHLCPVIRLYYKTRMAMIFFEYFPTGTAKFGRSVSRWRRC